MYDRLLGAKKKSRRRFCTRRERFPRGLPELLDIQLSNSVYGQNTVYLCLSKYSPTGSRCTTRSIAKKSPTGSLPPAVPLAITRTFRPWTHTSDDSYIYQLSLVVATSVVYRTENQFDTIRSKKRSIFDTISIRHRCSIFRYDTVR